MLAVLSSPRHPVVVVVAGASRTVIANAPSHRTSRRRRCHRQHVMLSLSPRVASSSLLSPARRVIVVITARHVIVVVASASRHHHRASSLSPACRRRHSRHRVTHRRIRVPSALSHPCRRPGTVAGGRDDRYCVIQGLASLASSEVNVCMYLGCVRTEAANQQKGNRKGTRRVWLRRSMQGPGSGINE